jgi:hypothetical protein
MLVDKKTKDDVEAIDKKLTNTDFNAKAILLTKQDNEWHEKEVIINSVDDIKNIFNPHQDRVEQVNLSMFEKLYYSVGFLTADGIDAKVDDMNEDRSYLVSPLLLVQCDETKPINITKETLNSIKERIDFD